MMLSSCSTKPIGERPMTTPSRVLPMKSSVIARPIAILAMFCFRTALGLEEEFHLHAGQLDHVVVLERVRRGADFLAVDGGTLVAFDVREEVALRPAREHRDLHAGLAERGERLGELELLAGVAAREELDGAERLACAVDRRTRRRCGGAPSRWPPWRRPSGGYGGGRAPRPALALPPCAA